MSICLWLFWESEAFNNRDDAPASYMRQATGRSSGSSYLIPRNGEGLLSRHRKLASVARME